MCSLSGDSAYARGEASRRFAWVLKGSGDAVAPEHEDGDLPGLPARLTWSVVSLRVNLVSSCCSLSAKLMLPGGAGLPRCLYRAAINLRQRHEDVA